MTENPTGKQKPNKMQVYLPANLEPIYANLALITHSPSEIVLDLAQVMPRTGRAQVKSRAVMTPMNAKLLLRALDDHLQRYEQQFGEIMIPKSKSLADELFRSAQDEQDNQNSEDES